MQDAWARQSRDKIRAISFILTLDWSGMRGKMA
jgi:hypothetical protein